MKKYKNIFLTKMILLLIIILYESYSDTHIYTHYLNYKSISYSINNQTD